MTTSPLTFNNLTELLVTNRYDEFERRMRNMMKHPTARVSALNYILVQLGDRISHKIKFTDEVFLGDERFVFLLDFYWELMHLLEGKEMMMVNGIADRKPLWVALSSRNPRRRMTDEEFEFIREVAKVIPSWEIPPKKIPEFRRDGLYRVFPQSMVDALNL